MDGIAGGTDGAHLLGGGALALSFVLLYARRVRALMRAHAAQAALLAAAAAWQGWVRGAVPLHVVAVLILGAGALVPAALVRVSRRLGTERRAEAALGVFASMAAGLALVALAVLAVMPTEGRGAGPAREDMALALSVVLLGLLVMATRRTALPQLVGLLSMQNGLLLAGLGIPGLPVAALLALAALMPATAAVSGAVLVRASRDPGVPAG